MKTCWITLAAASMLLMGCTDTEGNGDPVDAAVEAGLTPDPACDQYLTCFKAAKTPVEYDEEYLLFKAGGPCWANKVNCISTCTLGFNDLATKYTSIPACGGTVPDGGLDKGPDLGGGASTGSACTKNTGCQGGKCLKDIVHEGASLAMNGGYCTRDCTTTLCKAGEACYSSLTKTGKVLAKWCTRTCVTSADCRTGEGYTCMPSYNVCLPGSSSPDGGP
jgi:hypothetical protein